MKENCPSIYTHICKYLACLTNSIENCLTVIYIRTLNSTSKVKMFINAINRDFLCACKVVLKCGSFFWIYIFPVTIPWFLSNGPYKCFFFVHLLQAIIMLFSCFLNLNQESRTNMKNTGLKKGAHYLTKFELQVFFKGLPVLSLLNVSRWFPFSSIKKNRQ